MTEEKTEEQLYGIGGKVIKKAGGPMLLTKKQVAFSNLNLLQEMTGQERNNIRVELNKQELKASDYADVVTFIKSGWKR